MNVEKIVLKNLLKNENYTRKVLPFLKSEYFLADEDKVLFQSIQDFILKYNSSPTNDSLKLEIDSLKNITDDTAKKINGIIDDLHKDKDDTNIDWLVSTTEQFCQDKAIYNAIMKSIEIMNSPKGVLSKGSIPQLLSDALSISFDPNVGHDYFEQFEDRYAYYHRVEEKIPFDLEFFNKITKGGVPKKTLNMIMGGVHTGKSMFLCHFSAAYLAQGKNVLYITLEMAEEEIAKRIDCNLLNITFGDLETLPKDMYEKRVKNAMNKTNGKLIIKEYPATAASVHHFKALLNELELKKKFIPDIIMIDYINLCASSRLKAGNASDTYVYVKSIAEEIRGFGQQSGIPIWSATQLNRTGFGSSDPDMTNTAESFGLPATVDLLLVLIATEELKKLNQIMVKQLKNRYHDMELNKRFVVGVDKTKMKLFDVESSAQTDIVDSGQVQENQPVRDYKNKFKLLKV
jgi:replicative DNA helicase